jgi:hypothetical protein
VSFAKNAADAISAARDAAVGEATGADESDAAKSKRRRITALLASLGALGAVGTAGYYGYKNRNVIAAKGKEILKNIGMSEDKPGFFSRLLDKSTDGNALTGAIVGATQPGLTRGLLAGAAKLKVPGAASAQETATQRWAHQTTGEKLKTVAQRVLLGKAPQNTASGLRKRLEDIRARGDVAADAGGKNAGGKNAGGKNAGGNKLTEFFADPHTVQAERIAKQLGPKGTQGVIDLLARGQGRSVRPAVDAMVLKRRILAPLAGVQPAGQGGNRGQTSTQQGLGRAILPDVVSKKGVPAKALEATLRGELQKAKGPLGDYGPRYRMSPRNIAGFLGRGILGVAAQAVPRAWNAPAETP